MSQHAETGPEHLRQVQRLFHKALDVDDGDRSDFLHRASNGDPEVIKEVQRLLTHHDPDDSYLDPLCPDMESDNAPHPVGAGCQVGAYRLTRIIEAGGMGTVWAGERADGLFEQRVAVKLLSWGLVSAERRRRFDAERRTLAQLEHPYITRLIDGGTTNEGIAYLVMEYVEGTPIDAFCANRRLSLDDKLRLFCRVCEGVQHAHHHLIVHCDLKPGNILVTAQGCPKLVDFGLSHLHAGVTDVASIESTTAPHRAYTPQYASPEQRRGECLTTATDVYSLGVVLSKLLVGRRGHEDAVAKHNGRSQRVRTTDPSARSGSVAHRGAGDHDIGSSALAPHLQHLRGDLNSIAMQAMQVDPQKRYASVEQFSEDIRRYLVGLPVTAHPATVRYRLGKFLRRHAIATCLSTALALTLVAGSVGMTVAFMRASENARAAANAEAEANASSSFLTDMLESADPLDRRYKGLDYTVRELIDDASLRMPTALADFPAVKLALQATLGKTYRSLGMYEEGEKYLRKVLAARQAQRPEVTTDVAAAQRELGDLLIDASRLDEAAELLSGALTLLQQNTAADLHERANTLESLGRLARVRGRYEEAASVLRDALDIRRTHSPERDLAGTLHQLGEALLEKADYAKAVAPLRQALSLRLRILGEQHPLTAETMGMLGYALGETNRVAEARKLLEESVAIQRDQLGGEHPGLGDSLNLLALFHSRQGRLEQADELFREILAIDRKMLPPGHADIAATLINLSQNLRKQKRYEEARTHILEALDILVKAHGVQHPTIATAMANLGDIYWKLDRLDDAFRWLSQAHEIRRSLYGESHAHTLESLVELSALHSDLGNSQEAEQLARHGLAMSLEKYPTAIKRAARFEAALGKALLGQRRMEEAEVVLKSAHARALHALGPQHAITRHIVSKLAQLYEAWDKPQQAALCQHTLKVDDVK